MNISSIENRANTPVSENVAGETPENAHAQANQALLKVTDTASLSNLLPRLQNFISAIDQPGENVLASISDNITRLQDVFVDSLYGAAVANGVDLSSKLTLKLDKNEQLSILGEHPDKEKIDAFLKQRPDLSAAFKEISVQSELLKDMSNIGKIIGSQSGLASYQNAMNRHVPASYQISLKGEMSHFYFAKP